MEFLWLHLLTSIAVTFLSFIRVFVVQDEKVLRNNRAYTTIDTNKNGVRFRSSALRSFNDDYAEAKGQYTDMQRNVVNEVIAIASGYSEPLTVLSGTIALLDTLVTFAHVSAEAPIAYVRPKLHPKGNRSPAGRVTFCRCIRSNRASSNVPFAVLCTLLTLTGVE